MLLTGYTHIPELDENDDRRMNLRLACALFLTFAVVELIFGVLYSSSALRSDAVAMIVDSFAFLLNHYANTNNYKYATFSKVVAPMLSIMILYALIFGYFLREAYNEITDRYSEDSSSLAWLDIVFPVVNFVIDVIVVGDFVQHIHMDNMNEVTASIHAWADTGRTITVFIAGLISLLFSVNSTLSDGWL